LFSFLLYIIPAQQANSTAQKPRAYIRAFSARRGARNQIPASRIKWRRCGANFCAFENSLSPPKRLAFSAVLI